MLRPSETRNIKETRKITDSPNIYIKKRDSVEAFIQAKKDENKRFLDKWHFLGLLVV